MDQERRAGETVSDLNWESPPNNRFKPWPIEPPARTGGTQAAYREQQRGDGARDQPRDGTYESGGR